MIESPHLLVVAIGLGVFIAGVGVAVACEGIAALLRAALTPKD